MKKIVVAHFNDVISYPPVINLVECLLKNGCSVVLISMNVFALPNRILKHSNFKCYELNSYNTDNIISSVKQKIKLRSKAKNIVKNEMRNSDIIWTTTDFTVRWLGDVLFSYKHVMQLMELIEYYPMYPRFSKYIKIKYPIEKYAQRAWKVVVPEENRAYIQKVWWDLKDVPVVLPNKTYNVLLNEDDISEDIKEKLEIIKNEKRKVILYSGVLWFDRDFDSVVKAVKRLGDGYVLYIIGSIPNEYKGKFELLLKENENIVYLGYIKAPNHLLVYKYAYIGLLPYKAGKIAGYNTHISELNALYCAPNKIFEYAAMGLPMIGSNVLGLKIPFEKYGIGFCCEDMNEERFCEAVIKITSRYEEMSAKCKKYFASLDLDNIIKNIIEIG